LGLPDADHTAAENEFRRRYLSLALEAYRREFLSKGKLSELATMVGIDSDAVDGLIESAGIDDKDAGVDVPLMPT
jgi:hypothetical protein